MVGSILSFHGQLDRQSFLRIAPAVAGLCLLILFVIDGGGIASLAAKLGHPGYLGAAQSDVYGQLLGLAVVIFLPSTIIVQRLRDLRLPPLLAFASIALAESVVSGVMPHAIGAIEGPFAALALLALILVLLSLAPGNPEFAEESDAATDVPRAQVPPENWSIASGEFERRRDPLFDRDDRIPGDAAALEPVPATAPRRNYPDFTRGEGFGRRPGDRR